MKGGDNRMDKKKVVAMYGKVRKLPPSKARPIFAKLHKDKSWTNKEYNDLVGFYAMDKILKERKIKQRKRKK